MSSAVFSLSNRTTPAIRKRRRDRGDASTRFRATESLESRLLFATINVNPTGAGGAFTDINAAIFAAASGDTIQIAAGTYSPGVVLGNASRRGVFIDKPLTIRGAGKSSTIINVPQAANNPDGSINNGAAAFILASNVRIESLTLNGQADGIAVLKFNDPNAILDNIVLRDLNINPVTDKGFGSGLFVRNASNVLFENNTVGVAHTNAVSITENVTDAIIKGNTFLGSTRDYSISLGNGSTRTIVAGNTISGSPNGIAITSSGNSVYYNNVSGFLNDGITLDRQSNYNLIGLNLFDSAGLAQGRSSGSGIFLNSESNHNVVFNNRFTGSFENGVALFRVSNNVIWGNEVSGNGQGGIFLNDNRDTVLVSNGRAPQSNVLIENYSHDNIANGYIQGVRANNNEVARNFLSVTAGQGVDGKTGIRWEESAGNTSTHNTLSNLGAGIFIQPTSTNNSFYRNRFIGAVTNHIQSPATAALDAGPVLGGNYYSDNTNTAVGNPTTGAIYTKFIYTNGTTILDGHADAHPFSSESLGLPTDVAVLEPTATTFVGVGSRKTIRYFAPSATLVDITLSSPTRGDTVIATNTPNTGIFRWEVQNGLTSADDYTIRITPKNAAGTAIAAAGASATFSVRDGANPLTLLSPVRGHRTTAGTSLRVTWNYTSSNPVNVEVQTSGGAWTTLATGVTEDFATVTLPNTASSTARFRVVDPVTGSADTMDGFFSIQSGNGAFVSSPSGTPAVGSQPLVTWTSPVGSVYVNVELVSGSTTRTVVSELADIGEYRLLIPDLASPTTQVRLTFKNAAGTTISTVTSSDFAIAGTNAPITAYGPKLNPVLPNTEPPPPPPPAPDFSGTLSARLKSTYVVDGKTRVSASVRISNTGNLAFNGNLPIAVLVSPTSTPDSSAPILAVSPRVSLKANATRSVTVSFVLPTDRPTGGYNILLRLNNGNTVAENVTTNNLTNALPLRLEQPFVDLSAAFRRAPTSLIAGSKRAASFQITLSNFGNVTAKGSVLLSLLRSNDVLVGDDVLLASLTRRISIAAGKSTVLTLPYKLPAGATPGSEFILASVTPTTTPPDNNPSNQIVSTPITFS